MPIKDHRRRLIVLALSLLAAALLARAAWYFGSGSFTFGRRINLANHAKIQNGMSLRDIETVLGGPPGYYERQHFLRLVPYHGRNVSRESTPSTRLPVQHDRTDRERGTVSVQFDAAYKVIHVHFWPKF